MSKVLKKEDLKMQNQDKNVAQIKVSKDYSKFLAFMKYTTLTRLNYLTMLYYKKHQPLPIIEVKKLDNGFLEVLNDQESFFIAKKFKLPVYYYETFQGSGKLNKKAKSIGPTLEDLENMVLYIQGDC